MKVKTRKDRRLRIKLRGRKRIVGTNDRPRLAVFRSEVHTYAQAIDDMSSRTLAAASTRDPSLKAQLSEGARSGNKGGAQVVGRSIAEKLLAKDIRQVVFDRGGSLYHGRIRAVAEAAREAGLKF